MILPLKVIEFKVFLCQVDLCRVFTRRTLTNLSVCVNLDSSSNLFSADVYPATYWTASDNMHHVETPGHDRSFVVFSLAGPTQPLQAMVRQVTHAPFSEINELKEMSVLASTSGTPPMWL